MMGWQWHHLDHMDEDQRENYQQNCSVLCCTRQLCTMICTDTCQQFLKMSVGLSLVLCVCSGLAFCVFLFFFVFVSFAFVVLWPNSITLSWSQTGPRLVADLLTRCQRARQCVIDQIPASCRSATRIVSWNLAYTSCEPVCDHVREGLSQSPLHYPGRRQV